jgi:hypothetical protein
VRITAETPARRSDAAIALASRRGPIAFIKIAMVIEHRGGVHAGT